MAVKPMTRPKTAAMRMKMSKKTKVAPAMKTNVQKADFVASSSSLRAMS